MNKKRISIIIAVILGLVVIGWMAYLRWVKGLPWAVWTGFGEYTGSISIENRPKTLWDLLDLIIIPVLLAVGAYLFNQQQKKRDTQIETDRQQEQVLQNYLASMSALLIDKGLKGSKVGDAIRDVARSQTLTTLRTLDPTRKGLLVMFLYEADLIKKEPDTIVSLLGADLSGAILKRTKLSDADLNGAYLYEANMYGADLRKADLRGATLYGANLSWADLRGANLRKTKLGGAVLYGTDLSDADLDREYLSIVEMRDIDMPVVDIRKRALFVYPLFGVKYDKNTKWPEDFYPENAGAILEE